MYIYIYIYIYIYTHTYIRIYVTANSRTDITDHIYIYIEREIHVYNVYMCIYIYIYIYVTANPRTDISDLGGFDSSIILILRDGILMSIRDFPGNFESTNLSRDNLSRKIGRNRVAHARFGS